VLWFIFALAISFVSAPASASNCDEFYGGPASIFSTNVSPTIPSQFVPVLVYFLKSKPSQSEYLGVVRKMADWVGVHELDEQVMLVDRDEPGGEVFFLASRPQVRILTIRSDYSLSLPLGNFGVMRFWVDPAVAYQVRDSLQVELGLKMYVSPFDVGSNPSEE